MHLHHGKIRERHFLQFDFYHTAKALGDECSRRNHSVDGAAKMSTGMYHGIGHSADTLAEEIFMEATKQHTLFSWADTQKVLQSVWCRPEQRRRPGCHR